MSQFSSSLNVGNHMWTEKNLAHFLSCAQIGVAHFIFLKKSGIGSN